MSNTPPPSAPPTNSLPPLRRGLSYSFNDYDPDGKPQWMVYDAGRNKFFVIGWVEYEIIKRWDMGNPEKIIEDVNDKTTLQIDMHDIENVFLFLQHNYLIKQSAKEIYKHAKSQKLFQDENILHWLITYYLFFRIPLWHPNTFLSRTLKITRWLFSKQLLYVMSVLGIVALYQIGNQWDDFTHTFSQIFNLKGLFLYFIAFSVCKFCHEMGHAYMCKSYGIPVPTLGVAFLVFWPVLYTDTTLSWSLDSRQRLRIALAGIWVETYVTIIAALVWCNTTDTTIRTITYLVITVNWVSSLLINVSPFMRFDGYYVLADYMKLPNLQPRAFALARWQLRRWLFDWQDPPPERFSTRTHYFLVIYSYVTWIYRLALYLGIAALVYHFFVKLVGIVLFIIEVYYFILGPFVNEAMVWYNNRAKFTLNIHTIITICAASIALILFISPINTTAKLPATISYTHRFLVSPAEGIIATDMPAPGAKITANKPIITINSPELDYQLGKLQLEYKKTLGELRRSTINPEYANQKNVLLSNIAKLEAENQKLLELRATLVLTVPFDGILIDVGENLYKGAIIRKDEWIGDVINPESPQVEAFVSQIDHYSVKIGQQGFFYPANISESGVPVEVVAVEALNASQLNCQYASEVKSNIKQESVVETPCYQSSNMGGSIPTYLTNDGNEVPVNSVYRVTLRTLDPTTLQHVERGTVFLTVNSHSYAYRLIYSIKSILIEESGF